MIKGEPGEGVSGKRLSPFLGRFVPLLWIVTAFAVYLTAALILTVVSDSAAFGTAGASLVILILTVLWRRSRPERIALPQVVTPPRPDPRFWALVAAGLVACWLTGQLTASWVLHTIGSAQYDQSVAAQALTPLWLLMISAIILAPAGEEALLRGVAYPMVRRFFSAVPAALVTSTAFALIHGNLVQIMVALPLGILLAFVYERTQRLWSVIVLHAFFNAGAMLIPASWIAGVSNLVTISLSVILTAGCLWLLRPRKVFRGLAVAA